MFKHQIYDLIGKALKDSGVQEPPNFSVSYPPDEKMGDYSTNAALAAAKILKKAPLEIANKIVSSLRYQVSGMGEKGIMEKIEVFPPGFVNFYLKEDLVRENLANILKLKSKYGGAEIGQGKTVIIDYSAPNIAKIMHVGHLRSTIIGQALYNIHKFLGYKTVGDNHIGDWGTHFGKLIYAYKNFADKKKLKENFIEEITKLYVDFNFRAKENAALAEYARQETKKFQENDAENVKIWRYFVKESLREFNRIYKLLGVKIDNALGESFYKDMLAGVISECLEMGLAVRSEGALIIPLEKYNLPAFMIQKTDGATLYGTTDLATIKYRLRKWKPEKIIYVVANEQAGHLAQLFKVAQMLGWIKAGQSEHIKFGMVLGADGKKFSSREGKMIKLEDLIAEAIERAYKTVSEKNPSLPDKEKTKIARAVGLGAIKYNDLSQNRLTDISFDWNKMLNFSGNSAPYLQYTYARIKSILRKAKAPKKYVAGTLIDSKEIGLMKNLAKFPEAIEEAAEQCNPNIVANYIYNLANDFNLFYEALPVLKAEKKLRAARLALVSAVALTLKNGLKLLGIDVLERM